jgi:hypothetical protein
MAFGTSFICPEPPVAIDREVDEPVPGMKTLRNAAHEPAGIRKKTTALADSGGDGANGCAAAYALPMSWSKSAKSSQDQPRH